jgi:adenylate cyclase
MDGRIVRGVAEKIGAVLWYSDLRGYTHISDNAPPEQIIPLLNDYAEVVVAAVHGHGGDVLKPIGDGTLAIFTARTASNLVAPRSVPRRGCARVSLSSMGAVPTPGCRRPRSISRFISGTSSTAMSAARIASISQ